MKVVVQKFGGTCVDSEPNQLITAERIMEARDRGLHPIVVVSAMGRAGQPYSTVEMVNLVRRIHPDIEARELDLLMSCGEIISTVAMAHLLKTKGYETIAFSGGQAGIGIIFSKRIGLKFAGPNYIALHRVHRAHRRPSRQNEHILVIKDLIRNARVLVGNQGLARSSIQGLKRLSRLQQGVDPILHGRERSPGRRRSRDRGERPRPQKQAVEGVTGSAASTASFASRPAIFGARRNSDLARSVPEKRSISRIVARRTRATSTATATGPRRPADGACCAIALR